MPPRHRAPAHDPEDTDSEIELNFGGRRASGPNAMDEEDEEDDMDGELIGEEGEEEEDDANATPPTPLPNLDPPPSYLRDISTLASWTVSSSKPGCSIPQLRHPSPSLFWQSDGPQPHYLNIHFFKLVRIVGLRLYLDFEQDESYTPTRIIFLAGSGMNDLQEWSEMKLESPRGWIWVDFSNVGDPDSDGEDDEDENEGGDQRMLDRPPLSLQDTQTTPAIAIDASSDSENNNPQHQTTTNTAITPHQTHTTHIQTQTPQHTHIHTPSTPHLPRPTPRLPFTSLSPTTALPSAPQPARRPRMPVLRAHLVQIKILENHQNGKDTHLRGLQIFARSDEKGGLARGRAERGGGGAGTRRVERLERYELGGFEEGGIR